MGKETATQVADRVANESLKLIGYLETEVQSLRAQARNSKDWGFAGSLGHVRSQILDLLVGFQCHRHDGDEDETRRKIMEAL